MNKPEHQDARVRDRPRDPPPHGADVGCVQSTLVEHVAHTDLMYLQVDEYLLSNGLASEGDKVVVVSGSPPGIMGSTNDIRIHKVGDAVGGRAPIYREA